MSKRDITDEQEIRNCLQRAEFVKKEIEALFVSPFSFFAKGGLLMKILLV